MTATLSPEAADVLGRSAATDTRVHLPVGQLERKTYVEVNRFLERLGGRWDRRERAHVFTRDPRPAMEEALGAGVLPPPAPNADKELSYWVTPPAVAHLAVAPLVHLRPGAEVLEPSAGDGALVRAIRGIRPDVAVTAVEPDPGRVARLVRGFGGDELVSTFGGTFEDYAVNRSPRFGAVVMNPPFTLPGRRYAWAEHLMLAWGLLAPGGVLQAIVPASLEFGRQRVIAAARRLVEEHGGWSTLPDDAFRVSGTGVRTLLVSVTRPPR